MPTASSPSSPKLSRSSSCISLSHPHPRLPLLDLYTSPSALLASIQRPPLPKGSAEFETLIEEFRPRGAQSTCSTPRTDRRKVKADSRSTTPRLLLHNASGGAGTGRRGFNMYQQHSRSRAGLDSVSLLLCKKRILKFVERKRSELKDSFTTTQS